MLVALGTGAIAAPLTVFSQKPPTKIPRIAYVTGRNAPPDRSADAVRQGLRELGYIEGKNILFEAHYFGTRMEQIPSVVPEIVQKTDVLVCPTDSIVFALKQATKTVPIVVVIARDPVAAGLVDNLARPGGNITGISRLVRELAGKRLELLKETVPGLARVAVVWDVGDASAVNGFKQYAAAAGVLKLAILSLEVRRPNPDLEGAFQAAVKGRVGAVLVVRNALLLDHAKRLADLAMANRLPAMFEGIEFIRAGGLVSYSPDDVAHFRRAAVFVDKILKGAKPGELPMEQPTEFELVVNMKTAKALGLTIPQPFLMRADKVIE